MLVYVAGRRTDWLAIASALEQPQARDLANMVRAALAFGARLRNDGSDDAHELAIPAERVAGVRAVAIELGIGLVTPVDEAAAVAEAESILRSCRRSPGFPWGGHDQPSHRD